MGSRQRYTVATYNAILLVLRMTDASKTMYMYHESMYIRMCLNI